MVSVPLPPEGSNPVDSRALRRRIREAAWRQAGIVRSEAGMEAGLCEAEKIWGTLLDAKTSTPRESTLRQDLLSAAFTLRAILTAGLGRLESRGSFLRSDYPAADDSQWLRNSRLVWDAASDRFRVDYVPAEIS